MKISVDFFIIWVTLLLVLGIVDVACGQTSGGFNVLNETNTKDLFYSILSNASENCEGKNFYNFDSFRTAASGFPAFGSTGSRDIARREVAALLANIVSRTGEFCHVKATDSNIDYCDRSNTQYPCARGQRYYGRGPLQLSWNYNYGAAGDYLNLDLLNKPDLISTDSTISFKTALWFWMNASDSHTDIVSGQGFIETVKNIDINACTRPQEIYFIVKSFKTYCLYLGVDTGTNLSCFREVSSPVPSSPVPGSPIPSIAISTSPVQSNKQISIFLGWVIAAAALMSFLLLFFFCIFRIRQQRRHKPEKYIGAWQLEPGIINFNYSYEVLKEATKGFYAANKLGEGGFGEVYKGILSPGKEIAVKKLFVTRSAQAKEEFLTEVKIVSGFLHRNLVRLLGCCSKGQERFLVYEYMPNRSLDKHLFGDKGLFLNWAERYEIITGTARGLAYLHEHSHARIVHRDIKTSNILLDEKLQPKIADFGLAKLFPEDKTHVTTRVGGTIGYTAPEYAVHGLLTQKADVYSYGVVVLEIISGKRCNNTGLPPPMEFLLQWAWNSYERNDSVSIVDPKLDMETISENAKRQIARAIHIALLCTQSCSTQRPSMSNVLSMLTNDMEIIDAPTPPAFFGCQSNQAIPVSHGSASSPVSGGSMTVSLIPR